MKKTLSQIIKDSGLLCITSFPEKLSEEFLKEFDLKNNSDIKNLQKTLEKHNIPDYIVEEIIFRVKKSLKWLKKQEN